MAVHVNTLAFQEPFMPTHSMLYKEEVMVPDKQVRKRMKMVETGKTRELASLQTGIDRKTARKYLKVGGFPKG